MAARYFTEIVATLDGAADRAAELAGAYAEIADILERLSDKEMAPAEKTALIEQAASKEAAAVAAVEALARSLRTPAARE